jgi:two-component system nitrogen regulation sensor histidine kinase GlnL
LSPDSDGAESGEVTGVVVALRDRTVRNSLREIVSEREKLTSYGHIAAGIAHEVKNPLSGIRGAAELLELRATDDRSRDTLGLIVREVDRITALVDELMVFAKGEKLRPTRVNVHQVLDGVLHLLSMDPLCANVTTERFYDPSIPELEADADRLTQVFLNLGRNALQAMEEGGGTLEVHTGMTLHNRLSNADGQLVPTVEIAIVDSGPGIEPEVLRRLATPFYTTKAKGTGLGLAVARHWIACHGGNLRVTSELGEGAKLFVTLPLKPMERATEAASPRFQVINEGK